MCCFSFDHLGYTVLILELVALVLQGECSLFPTVQQQRTEVDVIDWENIVPKMHNTLLLKSHQQKICDSKWISYHEF